jgi:hypothetical protein
MVTQSFRRSEYDHCVYFKSLENGIFIILVLYVEDMLIARNIMAEISNLNARMDMTFDMTDLGASKQISGIEIYRGKRTSKIWISQQKHVENILLIFVLNNVKLVNISLASPFNLSSILYPINKEEKGYMSSVPYASAIGSLMYVMVCTRLDISDVVGVISRYMSNLGKEH